MFRVCIWKPLIAILIISPAKSRRFVLYLNLTNSAFSCTADSTCEPVSQHSRGKRGVLVEAQRYQRLQQLSARQHDRSAELPSLDVALLSSQLREKMPKPNALLSEAFAAPTTALISVGE